MPDAKNGREVIEELQPCWTQVPTSRSTLEISSKIPGTSQSRVNLPKVSRLLKNLESIFTCWYVPSACGLNKSIEWALPTLVHNHWEPILQKPLPTGTKPCHSQNFAGFLFSGITCDWPLKYTQVMMQYAWLMHAFTWKSSFPNYFYVYFDNANPPPSYGCASNRSCIK